MTFEWDEAKRQANLAKHGIDFIVAQRLFDGRPLWTMSSPRADEERYVSVGIIAGVFIAAVWLRREGAIRLISVRRSRDEEKRHYRAVHG